MNPSRLRTVALAIVPALLFSIVAARSTGADAQAQVVRAEAVAPSPDLLRAQQMYVSLLQDQQRQQDAFLASLKRQDDERAARAAAARQEAVRRAQAARTSAVVHADSAAAPSGSNHYDTAHEPPPGRFVGDVNGSPCGGHLPPCWTLWNESKGDPTATNFKGCSGRGCFGAWQYDPRTWNNYRGFARADQAPLSVQNEKAEADWDDGAGCGNWGAC